MKRRTVLQSALGAAGLSTLTALAQAAFPGQHEHELRELAAAVLPESLGRKATDTVAQQFVRWVHEYRPGAEMAPGYGNTRIQRKAASPAANYLAQLEQLKAALAGAPDVRRTAVAKAITEAGIRDLPNFPDGRHVAADLMTFWFQSTEANDIAYAAAVGKDQCRTIADSAQEPKPLRQGVRRG